MSSIAQIPDMLDSYLWLVSNPKNYTKASELKKDVQGAARNKQNDAQARVSNTDDVLDKYKITDINQWPIINPPVQLLDIADSFIAQARQLKHLAQENPTLTTDDLISPVRSEISKAIHALIWGVFSESARAMGISLEATIKQSFAGIPSVIPQEIVEERIVSKSELVDGLEEELDTDSTEAALQRVENLKRKYTPEKIDEMRKLRAEVEEILNKVGKIKTDDEKAIEAVLTTYGIRKFYGKVRDGNPIEFLKANKTYGRFLKEDILFKSDIRKIDKELLKSINYLLKIPSPVPIIDPLPTESHQTELIAAGVFGNEKQQQVAIATIKRRALDSDLKRMIRSKP